MVSKLSRGIVPVVMAVLLVAAVAHVASSNSGGAAGGHLGHHGFRHGGGMDVVGVPLPLLLRTANLTDSQKQQIQAIFQARREFAAGRISADESRQGSNRGEVHLDGYGSGQRPVQLRLRPSRNYKTQITNEQIEDAIAIRNVLTPAQLAQFPRPPKPSSTRFTQR